jgi:hypothetical protein
MGGHDLKVSYSTRRFNPVICDKPGSRIRWDRQSASPPASFSHAMAGAPFPFSDVAASISLLLQLIVWTLSRPGGVADHRPSNLAAMRASLSGFRCT